MRAAAPNSWMTKVLLVLLSLGCVASLGFLFLKNGGTEDPLVEDWVILNPTTNAEMHWNDRNILLAREYQIDLSKDIWTHQRDQQMAQFLHFFNSASKNVFSITPEDMVEEGYHRYSYSLVTDKRVKSPTIRIRDFSKGHRSGMTTVDIKYRNGDTIMDMFDLPGTPAPHLLETAIQKVEQDVHACDVRWSRGTRIFLDYSPTFENGEDALVLFPSLSTLGIDKDTAVKKQSMDVYYWQSSLRSSLPSGLEFKITFTLMYPSIEAAFTEGSRPKKDGEFSVRLFSKNAGHSRSFAEEDLKIIDDLFEELLWSDWNVDPDMECLTDPNRDPEEAEVWRLPI